MNRRPMSAYCQGLSEWCHRQILQTVLDPSRISVMGERLKALGGVHCRTQEIHAWAKGLVPRSSSPALSAPLSKIRFFSEENFFHLYREMLALRHIFS